MKVIALTYDYDIQKLSDIGRVWAKDVYVDKNFIFKYSAASYATFIDKNTNRILNIYTDDVVLMRENMLNYNINQNRILIHDFSETLNRVKSNLKYSFDILTAFIQENKSYDDFTVKIDNDLIFTGEIPEPKDNDVFVWKYERIVREGNPLMGEIKVATEAVNNVDFPIYNLGVLGIPKDYPNDELLFISNKMTSVDISDVTDLDTSIWHCCEQTANNWIFYTRGYNVVETHNIVKHHFDNKLKCIEEAKYLLK